MRKREIMGKIFGIALVFVMTGAIPPLGGFSSQSQAVAQEAKTWHVDDDFTDDPASHKWNTIEEALDNASNGDTIIVYDGTYQEHVTLDKPVTLETAEAATIDGGGTLSTVTIAADGCIVRGFNIIGSGSRPNKNAGIRIDSDYNTISDNTIFGNKQDGILLYGSYNTITSNLICENKGSGLDVEWAWENTIVGNTISDNRDYGIYLSGDDNILRDNVISGNGRDFGISDYGYYNDVDTSNTVDGKPIYYLVGAQDEVIDSESNAGYVIVIESENIVIEDLTFSNNDKGVCLYDCQDCLVDDVTAQDNDYGIYLRRCSDSTVQNCTISGNGRGFYLTDCYNDTLSSNHIEYNSTGIMLCDCDANLITENTVQHNEDGIVLDEAYDNVIESNEVLDSDRTAIELDDSDGNLITGNSLRRNRSGIELEDSCDCSIEHNLVTQSEYFGVEIDEGCGHRVYGNTISENTYYGIVLWQGEDNAIHHNNFIDNEDNSWSEETNSWDDGSEGNYWSDYEEKYPGAKEIDSTGIWDTPYEIPGDAGDKDGHPLVEPFENYEIGRKGDFDGDGNIDIYDFVLFAQAYGSELEDDNYNPVGDFDDDGVINIFDFVQFAGVYGT